MKKNLKGIIITTIIVIVIALIALLSINALRDENKLTVDEKKWINNNLSTLQSTNIINNSPVLAQNGYGVLFDFISDFSKEYQIKVNPITYNIGESNVDSGFKLTNNLDSNSVVFYDDYYVLISKTLDHININNLNNVNIGILGSDYTYLNVYIKSNLVSYNSYQELNQAFEAEEGIKYMLVPKTLYLDYTIKNNYNIIYHFGDIKTYYVYQMKSGDMFSTIIKKYFNNWKKNNLTKSLNNNLFNSLVGSLNLNESDISTIKSKTYQYGFVNNNPYEVLIGGNYGGIVAKYLQDFSEISKVEFKFRRYKNFIDFSQAVLNKQIDLYFNYYFPTNDYKSIDTLMKINYVIVAKKNNNFVANSLNSLQGYTIYALEDSILANNARNISNVVVKTYNSIDELIKISKKDNIILIDKETFDYLSKDKLSDYTIRYQSNLEDTYNFKSNVEESFYKLFSSYVMYQNPDRIKVEGLYNHKETVKKGSIFVNIAKYILIIIVSLSLLLYFIYRSSKKIKISKKIKKEDKIKFIDQLTSLKNRNYLNENIDNWNKNRIYPQGTIIIDLNKIQEINDTKGYDEGDRQIKAASNILIRTQLDNSDIMRTDGNEFLIYTIGYDKRAIESYIRKLIKEFKELPYDYSAIITYSIIEDDLKTIEDAINEAVDDMKERKQEI